MFDVCVVGHVTRDIIRAGGREMQMPGGTAYYAALAIKYLGLNVAVITRVSRGDEGLLERLHQHGVAVLVGDSPRTTTFVNTYAEDLEARRQRLIDLAAPFAEADIQGVEARVFHVGALTPGDVPLAVMAALAAKSLISLDAQGFLRRIDVGGSSQGEVALQDWPEKHRALPLVTHLKTDEDEARVLTGETDPQQMALRLSVLCPGEVIITRGSRGSLVYAEGKLHRIPAYPPRRLIDPTGCGDTYMAAYLYRRRTTNNLTEVGQFAARTATAKLERSGPLAPAPPDASQLS